MSSLPLCTVRAVMHRAVRKTRYGPVPVIAVGLLPVRRVSQHRRVRDYVRAVRPREPAEAPVRFETPAGRQGTGGLCDVHASLAPAPCVGDGSEPLAAVMAAVLPAADDGGADRRCLEEWGSVLSDEVMAAALIDRLLHHRHIVNIRGNSYRMRSVVSETSRRQEAAPPEVEVTQGLQRKDGKMADGSSTVGCFPPWRSEGTNGVHLQSGFRTASISE